MTKASDPNPLTVYDWIHLDARSLRRRGGDPALRIHYTGHEQPLAAPWLESIGKWGVAKRADLIDKDFPDAGLVRVGYGAFRSFKRRNRLFDAAQFRAVHGDQPWRPAEVCYTSFRAEQHVAYKKARTWASLGLACRSATDYGLSDDAQYTARIGMLSVEVVLWTRLFAEFLCQHELAYQEWEQFDHATKTAYWELGFGNSAEPWVSTLFLAKPAIADLRVCYPMAAQLGLPVTPRYAPAESAQTSLPL